MIAFPFYTDLFLYSKFKKELRYCRVSLAAMLSWLPDDGFEQLLMTSCGSSNDIPFGIILTADGPFFTTS